MQANTIHMDVMSVVMDRDVVAASAFSIYTGAIMHRATHSRRKLFNKNFGIQEE